jgi:hypothetical protein
MTQATNHRESYLSQTLHSQVEDLQVRLADSIDLIADTVGKKAEPLGYKLAERAEGEWMHDRMKTLGAQYKFVMEQKVGG